MKFSSQMYPVAKICGFRAFHFFDILYKDAIKIL